MIAAALGELKAKHTLATMSDDAVRALYVATDVAWRDAGRPERGSRYHAMVILEDDLDGRGINSVDVLDEVGLWPPA